MARQRAPRRPRPGVVGGAYEVRFGYGWGDDSESGRWALDRRPDRDQGRQGEAEGVGEDRPSRLGPRQRGFRVVDYKTGKAYKPPKDGSLKGGQGLQLPIYMLAAARMLEMKPAQGEAEYHYSTRIGGFKRARFTGADFAAQGRPRGDPRRDAHGHGGGRLPDGGHRQGGCRFCVADPLCPVGRMATIERKRAAEPNRLIERIREVE